MQQLHLAQLSHEMQIKLQTANHIAKVTKPDPFIIKCYPRDPTDNNHFLLFILSEFCMPFYK